MKADTKKEKKIPIGIAGITFALCVFFVFFRHMIYMSADEMGPISIAAYFAGYDWSSMATRNSYYSYGYALILYPLFVLFKTPESFYRSAIVINALFSACISLIAWDASKRLKSDLGITFRALIALFCGCFITNVSRSPSAWCEVFLGFLCWLLFYFFIRICEEGKAAWYIASAFTMLLLYAVHQRTIVIVFVNAIMVVAATIYKKHRVLNLPVFFLCTAVLTFIHILIKKDVKSKVWLSSSRSAHNDYGFLLRALLGEDPLKKLIVILCALVVLSAVLFFVLKKIKHKAELIFFILILMTAAAVILYSKKDIGIIKCLIFTASGHMMYMGFCTLALIPVTISLCLAGVYKSLNKMPSDETDERPVFVLGIFYILLAFVTMLALSVFMCHGPANPLYAQRSDYYFYGRYMEPMMGVICFWGLVFRDKIIKERKVLSVLTFLMAAFSLLSINGYSEVKDRPFLTHTTPAFKAVMSDGRPVFVIIVAVIFAGAVLFLFIGNEKVIKVSVAVLIVFSVISSVIYIREDVIGFEKTKYVYKDLIEKAVNIDEDAPMYYYGTEQGYIYNSSFIQYLIPDREGLICADDLSSLPEEECFIFTDSLGFVMKNEGLDFLGSAGDIYLLTNKETGADDEVTIPLSSFYFGSSGKDENGYPVSNGDEQIFMYGPYVKLDPGTYTVTLEYSAVSGEAGNTSSFEAYQNETDTHLAQTDIEDSEAGRVSFEFTLSEATENVEFRIINAAGQMITVRSMGIRKRGGN